MRLVTCAPLGLFLLLVLDSSECLQLTVRPDKGSSVTVSNARPLVECTVCTVGGVNDTQTLCHSILALEPEKEVKLLFNCSHPVEKSYTVTIGQVIECTKDTCIPSTVKTQPSLLNEFPRTFIWTIKAPEKTVVGLDVLGEGLRETSQRCNNGYQYSVAMFEGNGKAETHYCKAGSVTHLDLLDQAVVSMQVQPKTQVESVVFQASAGPLKGRTVVVTIDSSTTVTISRFSQEPQCELCSGVDSARTCSQTGKTLTNVETLSLEFSCLKPQEAFSVAVKKTIECTKSSCTPTEGELDPNLWKDFKRTLIWDISVPERTILSLDLRSDTLKQISAPDQCQEGPQYFVSTASSNGQIKTNTYCRGGPVSLLDLLGRTAVTIEVPQGEELDQIIFTAKAAHRVGRMLSVTPDPETIIIITRDTMDPDCSVCVDKVPKQTCDPKSIILRESRNTSVEFTCPHPEEVFTVEINREIDCTATSCSGNIVQPESSLFPDFNRTFTWDLKVHSTRAFQLDFPEAGMQQIASEETCPDEHTYVLVTYLRTGPANIGTFCKGGSVTSIQVRYKGRVSLQVPRDRKMDPVDFKLSVGPETNMLAIVKVNLPRGVSDTTFMSANYPNDFPDDQQMQWDFAVPGMHNYTVHFHGHTAPECLSKDVVVEYKKQDKKVTKVALTNKQPEHQQGNFEMVLKNCETNRTLQGLTLKYSVSVMRSGHPVLCTVDLTKQPKVSLQIEKVGSDPYCEMSMNSEVLKKINVAGGGMADLSFLDCPNEDVRLTASKVIGCQNVASCSETLLTVPTLDSCLRMPLHTFTWHVNIPQDSTIDLVSPSGGLQQSVPGQECNATVSLHVEESEGFFLGDFCANGIIQKVHVHANISITAMTRDFTKTKGPFLNVTFSEEIPETIIYKVSPHKSSPTLLATPNWPKGMRPSSTVSWIVSLPSQYQARVQVVNVTQPKCKDRHTAIKVKMLGSEKELLSRREDEKTDDKLLVPQSFYLNMSNCIPEDGSFGAVTKIVLEPKTNLLAILLGIVGALLLLLIILAVVCFFVRKRKKERLDKEASIYIGRGNIFRPGERQFSKARSDNESHVYASIDETMVYGHLLGESSYADSMQDHFKGMQLDSYHTFTGPSELPVINEPEPEPEVDHFNTFLDPSQSFLPPRPRTPIDRQDSLGFQDRRMVDNELYTFKNTGEMNTIRLSGADMEPELPTSEL
ncbi:CUB domain-containing protein 1 isoform X2 [Syngnathoides biaculeatus]|uniref:CUB domain-containing protein 1 isoform X2 n=1 Tax=Syngnathoides biaculeatus TaxID=300417 RepID=UPI002ADE0AD7|nr:CUB domain-containing protein 1 isoform X2 [Syngnathoides biaculeatus]XP_061676475.1 CUB domain-containing protein 1 isoform X2 [Syngnathoides biaculeatus]